jgi:cytochrome oxidase Cu insertion factor (SCO1/SenC/PrrC family)
MKNKILVTVVLMMSLSTILLSEDIPYRSMDGKKMPGMFSKFEEHMSIGSSAPEFTLKTIDGKPVSLSSFRGKHVVIEFGART